MLGIPVFVVYSFFIDFFIFFAVSLKLSELHEPIQHCFASQLCFSDVMENLRSKIKLKSPMHTLFCSEKNDSPERSTKAKKFVGSCQYKMKYNLVFSRKFKEL